MYIGTLARLTGTTPKTIRFYESIGLIPVATRRGKYRVYSDRDVSLVHMIRRAQAVGFNLAELKGLVAMKAGTDRFPLAIANELIARKREKLRGDMERIKSLDRQLVELEEELNRTFGRET